MAENLWVGVTSVSVTPDGQSAVEFDLLTDDSIELDVTVEDLVFKSASGTYDLTAVTVHISYVLTISTKEIGLADTIVGYGVDTDATIAWTLVGKDNADGSDRDYSFTGKLMNEPSPAGTDGMTATQVQLQYRGISADGTTSPLTRP